MHLSALPVWAMEGKGGMPSLRETLLGHVRGGHDIVLVLPKYNLFADSIEEISVRRDQGYDIHVVPCNWVRVIKPLQAAARRLGRGTPPYPIRWMTNMAILLLLTVSLVIAAMKVIRRSRKPFALIYAHNQYAALAGFLIGRMRRIPNVTRLYGTFLADLMNRPMVWLRYPTAAAGYIVPSNMIICANDGTRGDEVARKMKTSPERFRFWQNGVDLPGQPPDTSRQELAQRFAGMNLRPESKWIVSCSRLSYWKRIDRMLNAVSYCRAHGCDCQLLVAGDGPERESLLQLAGKLDIGDGAIWLGPVAHDDIWALLNVADVFMITNDVTNRCNPVYEAMCASLPVVSVRDQSTADLLEHEINALLADKDDNEALGACLLKVFGDSELASNMRKAQHERAGALWTWKERMVAEVRDLEELVKSAAEARGAGSRSGRL